MFCLIETDVGNGFSTLTLHMHPLTNVGAILSGYVSWKCSVASFRHLLSQEKSSLSSLATYTSITDSA